MEKQVLITGCSDGGIGSALARSFASRGAHVFATARNASRMKDLADLRNVTLITLDVTSSDQRDAAVQEVAEETGGRLDYLVNNSGQHYAMPALDLDLDIAKRLFDVNFWAVIHMTQSFIPLLIKTGGTIVNIGSITGVTPFPLMSIYSASKAALHAFDAALSYEVAPLGVHVMTVITGGVQSQIADNAPKFTLPPESRYILVEDLLRATTSRAKLDKSKMTKTSVYAEQVVDDILKGKSGNIWRGKYAGFTRWVLSRLPESVKVWLFVRRTGMKVLSASIAR